MSGFRLRRPRRRGRWRWAALIVLVLAGAWAFGLFEFASRLPAAAPVSGRSTDAIVVLTGGAGRVAEGIVLLEKGLARKLFVSGVYRGVDVQALLRLVRRAPGNLECCIVLGYAADDTAGNARETAAWMQREGYRSMRLVTASYHMPRSLLEFRRHLPGTEIVPHPVFPEGFRAGDWWLWPGSAGLLIREYNKYLMARAGLAGLLSPAAGR